jgi:NAD(P)-dependent dehydrogenase (short-subunit alcohol dehydrogenase family)
MNQNSLQDRVALIVGAGRAPAPQLALELAARGAVAVLNDLSPTLIDPVVDAICAGGGRAAAYVADATRGMPLRSMIDEVLADWERIDLLIINPRIKPAAPILEMDEWDWQRTVEMNLNGPFLLTQTVARLMREQGGGVILHIVDDRSQSLGAAGHAAYAASQRGLLELTQAAARELMAYNIRVYTLCPDEAVLNAVAQPSSGGESFHTGDLFSRFAAFLCSQDAASLNGQVFRIGPKAVSPQPGLPWQASPESSAGEQE